jgi:hypothetical protein
VLTKQRALGAAAVVLVCLLCAGPARAAWHEVRIAPEGRLIEGYASEVSVQVGKRIHFHVWTKPARRYRLQVYRLGPWKGSSPKRLACVPSCRRSRAGRTWRTPKPDRASGELDAGWPVTDRFRVPRDWRSGYYVAKAVLTTGSHRGVGRLIPFIVRAPAGNRSAILVQAAVSTWQAYNSWGGKSLYPSGSTNRIAANHVSFNRPYAPAGQSPFLWEIQLARFLEREGYDVSYTTDVDVHRDPSELLRHRLVITAGHDEYWSHEQFDGFEAARDAGVNLAFFGGNTAYWQVRYEARERTVVTYREADTFPDPARRTFKFRELTPPRPECLLLGVMTPTGASLSGPGLDYTINDAALGHPWFAGTGFGPGSVVRRIIGYEWDRIHTWCRPARTTPLVLFHREGDGPYPGADMVTYTAPSGATVFSAGSVQFGWALDGYGPARGHLDRRMQRFVRNMLKSLVAP